MSSELLPFRARGVGVGVLLVACLVLLMVAVEAHGSGEPAGEVGRAASLEVPATEALDTESLNRSLQEALATGQIWPTEPFASAAMLTGFSEAASLSIRGRWAGPEGTGPLTVVTVSDGFLDDSVRGEWRRYVFERGADGTWRIVTAERAWRCWRGVDDGFDIEPCP